MPRAGLGQRRRWPWIWPRARRPRRVSQQSRTPSVRDREPAAQRGLSRFSPDLLLDPFASQPPFFPPAARRRHAHLLRKVAQRNLEIGMDLADDASAIESLMRRYADTPMSLADACLVRLDAACDQSVHTAATCRGQRPPRSDLRSPVGGRPRKGDLPPAPRLSLSCVLLEISPSRAKSSDRVSRPHTSSVLSAKRPWWFAHRTKRQR